MPELVREVRYHFPGQRSAGARKTATAATAAVPVGPGLPRITRLMALAIKLNGMLQQNRELRPSDLATRGSVSRTRITQILNLGNLAPDIQERLLWLPRQAEVRDSITEKSLRRIAGEWSWERQRESFEQLLARRGHGGQTGADPQTATLVTSEISP